MSAPTPATANGSDRIAPDEIGDISTGTEIVVGELFGGMLDATIEERTYPAHEWQGPAEPPLVVPDEAASNEALIEGARRLVQVIGWRMRRTVQEWWVIGRHLCILKSRPENQGRWRKEILAEIGVNHTTDHQLRAMAGKMTFEQCLDFTGKTEALKSIGFFAAPELMQLGGPKAETVIGEPRVQAGVEGLFGIEGEPTFTLDDLGGPSLPQAFPFDEAGGQVDEDVEPPVGGLADEDDRPQDVVPGEVQTGTVGEGKAPPKAKQGHVKADPKIQPSKPAAKPAPQIEDEGANVAADDAPGPDAGDPMAGTEAMIVVLEGAGAGEDESLVAKSGFTVLAKSDDQVVGVIWYAENTFDIAREAVSQALGIIRGEKKNLLVEARYLKLKRAVLV